MRRYLLKSLPTAAANLSKDFVFTDPLKHQFRVLRAKGYGYKRIAGQYTSVAGEYIRHTTVKGGWLMFITEHGTLDYNSRDIWVRRLR